VARRSRVEVSLFPFMSVLACTIGALIMLLAVMSLASVGTQREAQQTRSDLTARLDAREQAFTGRVDRLELAEALWSEVDDALATRGLEAGMSVRSIDRKLEDVGRKDELTSELAEVERTLSLVEAEKDSIETSIAVLESRRETLPILIDPTGLSRHLKPFFVECDAGGITAHGLREDARYFVPAEELETGSDFKRYLNRVSVTPGALLVLLVRPDGIASQKRASRIAKASGVRVAKLPLPGQGDLDWSLIRKLEGER
jgi:hypothetical protein